MMSKLSLALIASTLITLIDARLLVLTTGPDACVPRKITKLKTNLVEAGQLADAAIKALKDPQVTQSQAFLDFIGTGKGTTPAAISAERYQSVKTALAGSLTEIDSLTKATTADVTFICPPDKEELKATTLENPDAPNSKNSAKCDAFFFALTSNVSPKLSNNLIKLCPMFFDTRTATNSATGATKTVAPTTLSAALPLYLAGTTIGNIPGMTILHEFQHSIPVVTNFIDDLEAPIVGVGGAPPAGGRRAKPAYSVEQCKSLDDDKKRLNAQNIAWFAVDVLADPTRGVPCGATSGPKTPRALPTTVNTVPKAKAPAVVPKAPAAVPKVPAAIPKAPPAVPKAPATVPKAPATVPKQLASTGAKKATAAPIVPATKPTRPIGGTVPSGARLARPAAEAARAAAGTGSAKQPAVVPAVGRPVATGNGTVPPAKAPAAPKKVATAPVCKVLKRGDVFVTTDEKDLEK